MRKSNPPVALASCRRLLGQRTGSASTPVAPRFVCGRLEASTTDVAWPTSEQDTFVIPGQFSR